MFRIGDFSKLGQVSVKTLRFYDEIGLLKPTYVDGLTGYRYYAMNLLPRLDRIVTLKELGFSLEEIEPLLEDNLDAARLRSALDDKRQESIQKIEMERTRLARIEEWARRIERGVFPDHEIRLKQIPRRLMASKRGLLASYEDSELLFEEINHYLKKHGAMGSRAAIWHSCGGRGEPIDCEAVVLVDRFVPESKRVRVYELPAGPVACVVHQESDESSLPIYASMRAWIKSHGYTVAGPNRELYWQGCNAPNDGATEIQFPIAKTDLSPN